MASGGNSGASAVKRVSPHEEVARQQAVSVVFSRFQARSCDRTMLQNSGGKILRSVALELCNGYTL